MTVARIEQVNARTVSTVNAQARAEQVAIRVVSREQVFARAEQVTLRMVSSNVPDDGDPGVETPEQIGERYFASVPTFALAIPCLEINHPTWAEPHRRVIQPQDWSVTIDGTPVLFPGWDEAGPWLGEFPAADEGARATRTLSLDDPDNALANAIDAVAESADPVTVRLWFFRSDVLDTPLITERYDVRTLAPGDARLDLTCVGRDLAVLNDPYIRHTRSNTPGYRGRIS